MDVPLPAENFDPIPNLSVLAPFIADPILGPARQTLEIRNVGRGPLPLDPVVLEGTGFGLDSSTCPIRLPPDLSCILNLSFQAEADGLSVGLLRIGNYIQIPLHGQAEGYASRLAFEGENTAIVVAGDTTPVLQIAVRLRNLGSLPAPPLTVRHVGDPLPGGHWAWDVQDCLALAPGDACELLQEGTAISDGAVETILEAPGAEPLRLRWVVSNLAPSLSIDPPGVLILQPGQTTTERIVRIRNSGNAPARLEVSIDGAGYAIAQNNCGAALPAGQACTIGVRWTSPPGIDRAVGTLRITPEAAVDLLALRHS